MTAIHLLDLLDYRRRVTSLYAEIRANPDPLAAWGHWRRIRDSLFRYHRQSALSASERAGFSGLSYFDYDPTWRFTADVEALPETPSVVADAGADGAVALRPFARTRGLTARLGADLTLYWIVGYGGGVFLPFRDGTSGGSTYGGGRYLVDTIKGADLGLTEGWMNLDFNFAYNPSCAYSSRWACPLAPAANRLVASITAGERQAPAR